MKSRDFVAMIQEKRKKFLDDLTPTVETLYGRVPSPDELLEQLKFFAYAEYRSSGINMIAFHNTPAKDYELKGELARQSWEEHKHYMLFTTAAKEVSGREVDGDQLTAPDLWKAYFDLHEKGAREWGLYKVAGENFGGEPAAIIIYKTALKYGNPIWRMVANPQHLNEEMLGHIPAGDRLVETYATTAEIQEKVQSYAEEGQRLVSEGVAQLVKQLGYA
jgi:hypothetical protein